MRLLAAALLTLIAFLGLTSCAGTNTAVGITTNQDAAAAEKRPR
jgi:hypothetical protein